MSEVLLVGQGVPPTGGYAFEGNMFKRLTIGIFGDSSNPARITRNQFINVVAQYQIAGGILHFTDNTRTPNQKTIPQAHRPFAAGFLLGFTGLEFNDNVFENNIVDGNVDGFVFFAVDGACKRNVLRKNIVTINQAILQEGDGGTLAVFGSIDAPLDNHLVEGNVLDGAMGNGSASASSSYP